MISEKVLDAILSVAREDNKNKIIRNIISALNKHYFYNDDRQNHIIETLVNDKAFVNIKDIDTDHIIQNINKYVYEADKKIIQNINVDFVDNIDCTVIVSYSWKNEIDEDRADIGFTNSTFSISFIDCPKVLKKS